MDTAIEPTNAPGTDDERSPSEDWKDDATDEYRGGNDVLRSVLPIIVGTVAVGIAAFAVIGVRLHRRRTSKTLFSRAAGQAEDAIDALAHAAAELPERGKAAARRVWR
jgi:hypothetical protein